MYFLNVSIPGKCKECVVTRSPERRQVVQAEIFVVVVRVVVVVAARLVVVVPFRLLLGVRHLGCVLLAPLRTTVLKPDLKRKLKKLSKRASLEQSKTL